LGETLPGVITPLLMSAEADWLFAEGVRIMKVRQLGVNFVDVS